MKYSEGLCVRMNENEVSGVVVDRAAVMVGVEREAVVRVVVRVVVVMELG